MELQQHAFLSAQQALNKLHDVIRSEGKYSDFIRMELTGHPAKILCSTNIGLARQTQDLLERSYAAYAKDFAGYWIAGHRIKNDERQEKDESQEYAEAFIGYIRRLAVGRKYNSTWQPFFSLQDAASFFEGDASYSRGDGDRFRVEISLKAGLSDSQKRQVENDVQKAIEDENYFIDSGRSSAKQQKKFAKDKLKVEIKGNKLVVEGIPTEYAAEGIVNMLNSFSARIWAKQVAAECKGKGFALAQ